MGTPFLFLSAILAIRRFAKYNRMLEVAAVIKAHDRSEGMDAAIDHLVKAFSPEDHKRLNKPSASGA